MMEKIFTESQQIGMAQRANARWSTYEGYIVERAADGVTAQTTAHYNDELSVLVVDHTLDHYGPRFAVDYPRRFLETIPARGAATRRAIELADLWIAAVRAALPTGDTRPDEVLIEEYKAAQKNGGCDY